MGSIDPQSIGGSKYAKKKYLVVNRLTAKPKKPFPSRRWPLCAVVRCVA